MSSSCSDSSQGGADETLPPIPNEPPSSWLILRAWFFIGIQSFGGGMATLALIKRAVVEERGWISEIEFARFWALVQITPGINLLALTILIGRRIGGIKGVILALTGLLLPSVSITLLMTAGYARVRQSPAVLAALHGVLPATIGLGLATGLQMARSLLTEAKKEGQASLLWSLAVLAGSALAVAWGHLPVILVLLLAGTLYALIHWQQRGRTKETAP